MHKYLRNLFSAGIVILFFSSAYSQTVQVEIELFSSGFNNPSDIVHAGDERLFIVEQQGRIKIINPEGVANEEPFLDITDIVNYGGERGLLGLAFHPQYQNNGLFYVNYINNAGNTVIARYHVSDNPDLADPESWFEIMEISQPAGNHNGGDLEFGPDGYLYIAMGDGGGAGDTQNNAQTTSVLLGKMLRIDVDEEPYSIPPTNPFINDSLTLDEIWAIGLRNPWRFAFDRETGDLWIADVGQGQWEEVNFQPAASGGGENYGWRCFEGNSNYNSQDCNDPEVYDFPAYEYSHSGGHCSITGGRIYRGGNFPLLNGHYFFADYCSGLFRSIQYVNGELLEFNHDNLEFGTTSFGENLSGEIFLVNGNNGNVYTLTESCSAFFPVISQNENVLNANVEGVDYQWFLNGQELEGEEGQTLDISENGDYSVTVSTEDCEITSEIFTVNSVGISELGKTSFQVFPNPVSAGEINLILHKEGLVNISLFDISGRMVYDSRVFFEGGKGKLQLNNELSPGIYSLVAGDQWFTRLIILDSE